jgi:hypothetical protein
MLAAVIKKIAGMWDVPPCSLVYTNISLTETVFVYLP